MKKIVVLILLCAQLSACASKGAIHSAHSNSSNNELLIGRQIHEQIIARMVVYSDPSLNDYITEIGNNLAAQAKRKELRYQFIILHDDRIYATRAPGGFVYITTGFIKYLANESELAAILAHEVSGLQTREQRLSKARAFSEKLIAGGALVAPFFGNIGALAILGAAGIHSLTGIDPSSQKQLIKTDRLAVRLMNAAGYDPQGLIDVERKILNANSTDLMYLYDYHQTRMVTDKRIKKLEQAFSKLDLNGKVFSVNRDRFLLVTQPLHQSA